MSDQSAFARAFKQEMDAWTHETLVETYVWANSTGFGRDPELVRRGEAWASELEDAGLAHVALMALAAD